MPDKKYIEQDHGEEAGAVDSLIEGASKQAGGKKKDAVRILKAMLGNKKEQIKAETTTDGMHETWNWIGWLETAIQKLRKSK